MTRKAVQGSHRERHLLFWGARLRELILRADRLPQSCPLLVAQLVFRGTRSGGIVEASRRRIQFQEAFGPRKLGKLSRFHLVAGGAADRGEEFLAPSCLR